MGCHATAAQCPSFLVTQIHLTGIDHSSILEVTQAVLEIDYQSATTRRLVASSALAMILLVSGHCDAYHTSDRAPSQATRNMNRHLSVFEIDEIDPTRNDWKGYRYLPTPVRSPNVSRLHELFKQGSPLLPNKLWDQTPSFTEQSGPSD
jgi:hypothetical protein